MSKQQRQQPATEQPAQPAQPATNLDNPRAAEYKTMIEEGVAAIRDLTKAEHVGAEFARNRILPFYGNLAMFTAVRVQFTHDVILAGLVAGGNAATRDAYVKPLMHKKSKDYAALDEAGRKLWEVSRKAKHDAQVAINKKWDRLAEYAFPEEWAAKKAKSAPEQAAPEQAEQAEQAKKDAITRILDHQVECLKILQNAEGLPVDAIEGAKLIKAAMEFFAKGAEQTAA